MMGMSLRGLLQTVPIGMQFWWRGYGWLYAFCGAAMGCFYAVGWHIDTNWDFDVGIPNAEFIWVCRIEFCLNDGAHVLT